MLPSAPPRIRRSLWDPHPITPPAPLPPRRNNKRKASQGPEEDVGSEEMDKEHSGDALGDESEGSNLDSPRRSKAANIKQEDMEMDEDEDEPLPSTEHDAGGDDDAPTIIKQSIEDEIKPAMEEVEPSNAEEDQAPAHPDQLQEIDAATYAPAGHLRDQRLMLDHLGGMNLTAPSREVRSAAPRDLSAARLKDAFESRYKSGAVTRSGFRKRFTEEGEEEQVRAMVLEKAVESERGKRVGRLSKNRFSLEVAVKTHMKEKAESMLEDEEEMQDAEE